MPCKLFTDETGSIVGIICSRRNNSRCHVCGKPMTSLCDATRKDGHPCDNPMCDEHKHTVGPDTDVCGYHNYPKYIESALKNRSERGE